MPWPLSQDYNEAIQNPALSFADPELRKGEAVCNALGLPQPCSGNFADVYAVKSDQRKWAVKCFTREIPGLQERYVQISKYLKQVQLPFMVEFTFLEKGIQVRGQWYPVLKMQWVEGFQLNTFVRDNHDRPAVLQTLCQIWTRLAAKLREANLAHGDLQHGNVLLVPGSKAGALGVKLVDYDGMCVPALEQLKSIEVGHPCYQHPQRLKDGGYGLEIDRFSHLVIYTALRALSIGGKALWQRFDNGDNLLFTPKDFEAPGRSAVFQELMRLNDPELRRLVQTLSQAAQGPLSKTPLLSNLLPPETAARPTAAKPAASAVPTAIPVVAASAFAAVGEAASTGRTKYRPKSQVGMWLAVAGVTAAAVLLGGIGLFFALSGPKETGKAIAEIEKAQPSRKSSADSRAHPKETTSAILGGQTKPAAVPKADALDTAILMGKPRLLDDTYHAGDTVRIALTFTNVSDRDVAVPLDDSFAPPRNCLVVLNCWIERLGEDPSIPPIAPETVRRGRWYNERIFPVFTQAVLDKGSVTSSTIQVYTGDYPAGKYRYLIEYKRNGKEVQKADEFQFELTAPPIVKTVPKSDPVPDPNLEPQPDKLYLCELQEIEARVGWGQLGKKSELGFDNLPIEVKGKKYQHGLGTHPPANGYSFVRYKLNPRALEFRTVVALNDSAKLRNNGESPVIFSIIGDGKTLWTSKPLQGAGSTQDCKVKAKGLDVLELRAQCGASNSSAHAVWLDPYVTMGLQPKQITNSIGMKLVKIPAGKFTMGSPNDEKDRQAEEEQHQVEITRPYWMGVYHVTQEQYEKVMGNNPSRFRDSGNQPVDSVSWQDAKEFCAKLSALPDEVTIKRKYRLPTEAEWEYACRGGADTYSAYSFGDTISTEQANFNNKLGKTKPVGTYQPNAFGLYDMHGNLNQWCEDWYGPYDRSKRRDPTGSATGSERVWRGGSWAYFGPFCRSAYRFKQSPTHRDANFGFRVVASP